LTPYASSVPARFLAIPGLPKLFSKSFNVKVRRRHIERLEARVPDFYEFFAGGGMARAGLSTGWECLFANDFDHKKSTVYRRNWRDTVLTTADIRTLTLQDVHGHADLAWASFPCQDLLLARGGAGLKGDRSGTFWPFWSLMKKLMVDNRAPRIIALENVCGTLTSHDGKDFAAICATFDQVNYTFGALVIDAALFVPQSRPRLFIIGVRNDVTIPAELKLEKPSPLWHPRGLLTAHEKTPPKSRRNWIWWALPNPPLRNQSFSELILDDPPDVNWHTPAETRTLLDKMSEVSLAKVAAAKKAGRRVVGAIYKRTRLDENGFKVQRAEVQSRGKRLAVLAPDLALQPRLRNLRRHCRRRMRSMEQAHRPTRHHNFNRHAPVGSRRSEVRALSIIRPFTTMPRPMQEGLAFRSKGSIGVVVRRRDMSA
jgi:DNA (cytosine-5)-methyltransferase 1